MEKNLIINRRHALGLFAAGLTGSSLIRPADAGAEAPVLVELFTSQGCSSCPPADKIAGALKKMPGVTVVSLNVDYWDYLGWRDTLAKPEFTQRQYDYAKSLGESGVYTPQMVINGTAHAVGNRQGSVEDAIAKVRGRDAMVPIRLDVTDAEITIDIGAGAAIAEATVWLMAIAPTVDVVIERGENTGSQITYHNAARSLMPAGMWTGEPTKLTMPRKAVMTKEAKGLVAVLQTGKVGSVLGFSRWSPGSV